MSINVYNKYCKACLNKCPQGIFLTSSSFVPMQDRYENTDRKSKDNERNAEKGRGYMVNKTRNVCRLGRLTHFEGYF